MCFNSPKIFVSAFEAIFRALSVSTVRAECKVLNQAPASAESAALKTQA